MPSLNAASVRRDTVAGPATSARPLRDVEIIDDDVVIQTKGTRRVTIVLSDTETDPESTSSVEIQAEGLGDDARVESIEKATTSAAQINATEGEGEEHEPSPDRPLPHPTYPFNIVNHAPARHPAPPLASCEPRQMTSAERLEEHRREEARSERERAQRTLREAAGAEWAWEWRGGSSKGKEKEVPQALASITYHSAAFFPYADLAGLNPMRGVLAVVGDNEVQLRRVDQASTSHVSPAEATILARYRLPSRPKDKEELFTCAWSVNISTAPYTPVLAVAGAGRTIEVFLVAQRPNGEWILHHDRTLPGHGGHIYHLAFHPSYPHVLASCSEDKTVRLWDAALPWGSNRAVCSANRIKRATSARPRVEGELLAVFAEQGHEKAVLSCDLHATQPMLVTAGADGFIRLWYIPRTVFAATPYWPTTPLWVPPEKPPSPNSRPPILGPPFFSSLAVHPGQWPDQVLFASPTTCEIISKASVAHDLATFSPRKSVKVWVPTMLDLWSPAVERAKAPKWSFEGGPRSDWGTDLSMVQSHLRPDARSDASVHIAYEAVLEDQNCIGDEIGWYRPSGRATQAAVEEPFFVVATNPSLSYADTASGRRQEGALYSYRPFAPPLGAGGDKPAVSTSSSPPSQRLHPVDRAVAELFPSTRDRSAHDFVPRLLPSFVSDGFSPAAQHDPAGSSSLPHVRCVAVDPSGGKYVVAVGEGGFVRVHSAHPLRFGRGATARNAHSCAHSSAAGLRRQRFARSAKPFPELLDALDRVVEHAEGLQVDVPKLFENCHQRGSRAQAIFGVDRPYSEDPKIRHSRKSKAVKESLEEFLLDKDLDTLNKHVELFVQTWCPGVHRRLFESNQKAADNFKNRFGIFPLLAINLPFRKNGFGATPHRDWKNPAGSVCVVLAGGKFESKDHHHLVLDDLGVSLEVPRGVLVAFPSSLITHYNHDFAEPVPDSRMSMVWFAQANLLMHREHGVTAAEAKKRSIRLKDENIKTIFRMSWS